MLFAGVVTLGSAAASVVLLAQRLGVIGALALGIAEIALVPFALGRARNRHRSTAGSARVDRGFDDAAIGMLILSPQLAVLRANRALCALLGRTPDELLGRSILEFTHPEDVQRSLQQKSTMLARPAAGQLIKRYLRPDGAVIDAVVTTAYVEPDARDSEDASPYFFSQLQDVTEQRRAERQKAVIAELGHGALECSDVMNLMAETVVQVRDTLAISACLIGRRLADGDVRVVAATDETLDLTVPRGQPSQTAFTLSEKSPVLSNDLLDETRFSVPAMILTKGVRRGLSVPVPERIGARYAIVAHAPAEARPFRDEDARFLEAVAHVVGCALDRAASEEELRRRALEDPLTGLANRALLSSQLETELRHARRLGNRVSVLELDLDRFKAVNDTLGHTAGDLLLCQVAARLTACVREEDLVSRPGGDEFTIVATRTADDHAIASLAQRLVDSLAEPFELQGHEVFVTGSVGVAVSDQGIETPEELLRDADAAMYRAKELGGACYEVFDAALRDRLIERMEIEADLRHALERDELLLHYQPLIALDDDRVIGFEALIRWQHPERGMMRPDQFIPIAEETGLVVPLGSWVLRAVCEQLTRWPESIHVSANVSPLQVKPQLVDEVAELIARHDIAPRRLVLEITESLVLDPDTKPIVARLRELGVQLALDDFGTGYSSLGSLQRFPLDVLKLDRTLISSMTEDGGSAVVRAAIELGRALGVSVIAEGVEGHTQLRALRALGCRIGQGYLFARPMPASEAEAVLAAEERSSRSAHADAA